MARLVVETTRSLLKKLSLNKTYVKNLHSWAVFFLSLVLIFSSISSKAQSIIPFGLSMTITSNNPKAKVGDIVTYTIKITPSLLPNTLQETYNSNNGGFTDDRTLAMQAIGEVSINASNLEINSQPFAIKQGSLPNAEGKLSSPITANLPHATYKNHTPNVSMTNSSIFTIQDLPLCRVYSKKGYWESDEASVAAYGTYELTFSGKVLNNNTSTLCTATINTTSEIADGENQHETKTILLKAQNISAQNAQTIIEPTLAPISNIVVCDGNLLSVIFESNNAATPNPKNTVYSWTIDNTNNINGAAAGTDNKINSLLTLQDSTKPAEIIYTVVPSLATTLINSNTNIITKGSPITFKVTVGAIPKLTTITRAQNSQGAMVLTTSSNISNILYYLSENGSQQDLNKTGVFTIYNWQKGTKTRTFEIVGVNQDSGGCSSNVQTIQVAPLQLSLTSNPTQLQEGSSGFFKLNISSLDANNQSFNKDETFKVSALNAVNAVKNVDYQITENILVKANETTANIPIKILTDNILFDDGSLDIQLTNDNLGSAIAHLVITDMTAANSENTKITLDSGTIFNDDEKEITLSAHFPGNLTAVSDTKIIISKNEVKSNLGNTVPKFSPEVIIKAGDNSGQFTVSGATTGQNEALLVLSGNTSTKGITIIDSKIRILNQKIEPVMSISANGDGINDSSNIQNIEKYPNNTVYIYNRWGQEEWHTQGYKNNDQTAAFWGRSTQNDDLSPGTHYYVIRFIDKGEPYVFKGFLEIKRDPRQ